MRQIRIQLSAPGSGAPGGNGGPGIIARVLLSIGALVMLVIAAFLGAIFFLVALGFFAIGMVVLAVRIWWAKRQLDKALRDGEPRRTDRSGGGRREDIIEGEYRVVDEHRENNDGDDQHGGGVR